MASINFNPSENWFRKPPNPIPPLNLHAFSEAFFAKAPNSPNFSAISISSPFKVEPNEPEAKSNDEPGYYQKMAEQFFWECENLTDYRHIPEVDQILNKDPIFEKQENPFDDEVKENKRFWREFRSSLVVQFLERAKEIADKVNELELKENENPYHKEDRELWKAIPHVPGLDGRPMLRKAIKTKKESDDKFWDFARQFFFGL